MGEYTDVWFCDDCTIAEVNGDYSGMTDERALEVAKAFEELPSRVPCSSHVSANWDSETGEGIREFSREMCFCCDTRLGGGRHRFALWRKEDPSTEEDFPGYMPGDFDDEAKEDA